MFKSRGATMLETFLPYGFQALCTALVTAVFFLIQRLVKKSDDRRKAAEDQREKEATALHAKLDAQAEDLRSMAQSMECFQKAQHACQLENAKEFATKEELDGVWKRVDANTADIAYLKGRGK